MKFWIRSCLIGLGATLASLPAVSSASVIISGTRIIYPGNESEVVVALRNEGITPVVAQMWLEKSSDGIRPGGDGLPFLLTPPLARIESKSGQSIRIAQVNAKELPQDRESVFWFNVLEVPPRDKKGEGLNKVKVAFRSAVKLFYRPQGLPGNPGEAARGLSWSAVAVDGGYALRATNSAAYAVNVGQVSVTVAGKTYSNADGGTVLPKQSYDFRLKGLSSAPKEVSYKWLNDYGVSAEQTRQMGR